MAETAPKLYKKHADQVISEIETDLETLSLGWQGEPGGPGWALVRLFGRLSELSVNRLNRVPEKHFFAFLNTAGIDFVPPGPAGTELTFTMAEDGPVYAVIPQGAQMATAETETAPEIVFETDRDMVLCPNSLTCAFSLDSVQITDNTPKAAGTVNASYPMLSGDLERERTLFLSDQTLFVFADDTQREAARISLFFSFETAGDPGSDGWNLSWSYYDGKGWKDLSASVSSDGTAGFSRDGTVELRNLPALSESDVNGTGAVWIACSLKGGSARSNLPVIRDIRGSRTISVSGKTIRPDGLFSAIQSGTTFVPLDADGEFFPFGQKPSRLDAFYLQLDEALNKPGGTLSFSMNLEHAPDGMTPANPPSLSASVSLEYYGADGWDDLSMASGSADFTAPGAPVFGVTVPSDIKACTVNEITGHWIRLRVTAGNFEIPGGMVERTVSGRTRLEWDPPQLYAPIIRDLEMTLDYTGAASEPQRLSGVVSRVDQRDKDLSSALATGPSVEPFRADDEGPSFYMGFARAFPSGQWMQIRVDVDEDKTWDREDAELGWEYYNGRSFSPLRISDGTENLSKTGYVGFFAPEDFGQSVMFGTSAHYIRVCPEKVGTSGSTAYLKSIRPNTIPATQAVTVNDQVLGSSDGKENQRFIIKSTPVHFGVRLAVLEPDRPPDDELTQLKKELDAADPGAAVFPYSTAGSDEGIGWVRWIQVENFFSSTPRSRHFTLDASTGVLSFGDGERGAIPPVGMNNIKAVRYRTHSGSLGNVGAGTVVVVRNPAGVLENIKTVTNYEASAGGSDVETLAEIRSRGPQRLKHRERSVAWEDYEWLAREASSEVRSARCFPVTDVLGQTLAGHVTVVITPESRAGKPMPGPALIRRVKTFLEAHTLGNLKPEAGIHVKGPSYVACTVNARVQAIHPESSDQVELAVLRHLTAFLDPLTGGPEKTGWRLGRDVYLSEIAAEIETVAGVDHVESLSLSGSLQQFSLVLAREEGAYRLLPFTVPAGSQVSTFDERFRYLLADPLMFSESGAPFELRTLTAYGFKADDTVTVVRYDNTVIKDALVLSAVSDTRITFSVPFTPPSGWEQRSALLSRDQRVRVPLSDTGNAVYDTDGKVTGLVLSAFAPGDRVCVVTGGRRDPVLEFLPVSDVAPAQTRVYVPETCLVYSGTHDIEMIIGD